MGLNIALILFHSAELDKIEGRPEGIITAEVGNWFRNERSSVLKTIEAKNVGEVYPTADARLLRLFGRFMETQIGMDDYFFYDRTTAKAKKAKKLLKSKTRVEIEDFLMNQTSGAEGKN
jgi:hypothetical protein